MDGLIIRQAESEDAPFLKTMMWEAILASPGLIAQMGLEKLDRIETAYWLTRQAVLDPALVAAGPQGDKLGGLLLRPHERKNQQTVGWRFGVGVIAEARGQGIGKALIEQALIFCRQEKARYLALFVDEKNLGAIALYRKLGFVPFEQEPGLIQMRVKFKQTKEQNYE